MPISNDNSDPDFYKYKKVSTVRLFGRKYNVIHEKNNVVNNDFKIYIGLCLSTIENFFKIILNLWKKKYIKIGLFVSISALVFTIAIQYIIANEQLRYRANACMDVTHQDCESFILSHCEDEVIDFIMSQNTTIRKNSSFDKLRNCIKETDPSWFHINFAELLSLFMNICAGVMVTVIMTACLINSGQFILNVILLIICKYKKCATYEIPEVRASSIV